jgi:hypothetical protein
MKEERRRWAGLKSRRFATDVVLALVVTALMVVGSQQELRRVPGSLPLDPGAFVPGRHHPKGPLERTMVLGSVLGISSIETPERSLAIPVFRPSRNWSNS